MAFFKKIDLLILGTDHFSRLLWKLWFSAVVWKYNRAHHHNTRISPDNCNRNSVLRSSVYPIPIFTKATVTTFCPALGFKRILRIFYYFCAVFALIDELSLTMMIISVTTFALGCAYHFYTNSKKLMNFNISMIGVCFFIAYLNLFADLTSTGIGLIISGIVLLGLLLITKKLIKYLSMLKEKTHGW